MLAVSESCWTGQGVTKIVTYGDTLVFRDMYALSVAYINGIKGHASNPTPVYKDIPCSVATGLIYVML